MKDGGAEVSRLWLPDWLSSLQPCRPTFSVCGSLNQVLNFFFGNRVLFFAKCNHSAQGPDRTGNVPGALFDKFDRQWTNFRRWRHKIRFPAKIGYALALVSLSRGKNPERF